MINIFNSKSELSIAFCSKLFQLSSQKEKFNLALSGGSTPKIIFQTLSKDFSKKLDWNKIRLFWGDERCVPPDHPESNYGMTKKYLLDRIDIPEENVHRIKGENNPDDETERYSDIILNNLSLANGLPQFDLVMLGLGEDGHTASIFPDQMELISSERICETAIHPSTRQKRITITGKVINNAERICFLVTGRSKSEVLSDILYKKENNRKYPATYIEAVHGILEWYLDKDAAGLINL
jgi:6-phosphogluconolactonase